MPEPAAISDSGTAGDGKSAVFAFWNLLPRVTKQFFRVVEIRPASSSTSDLSWDQPPFRRRLNSHFNPPPILPFFPRPLLFLAALILFPPFLNAAEITWQAPFDLTSADQIDTGGTQDRAVISPMTAVVAETPSWISSSTATPTPEAVGHSN